MRRNFKPYNNRKPFKRKSGGSKYMLRGYNKYHPAPPDFKEVIAKMLANIFTPNIIRTTNK